MKQDDLLGRKVNLEDMVDIQKSMDEAQKDDTPFAVVKDDSVKVAGNANKTEIKRRNYSVRMRFTKAEAELRGINPKEIIKTIEDYVIIRVDFEDVHIVPRRDLDITAAIVRVIPYFQKIKDKDTEDRSQAEMLKMVQEINEDIGDDLYNLVAAVLNIDRSLTDHMIMTDVLDVVEKLPEDFPEVFREADAFFE